MSDQYTTIDELNEQHLQQRAGFELKDIVAQNGNGDVYLVEFDVPAKSPLPNGKSIQTYNLIIRGNPLDVRMKLINDLEIAQDIVLAPICTVLEDGMNWVRNWKEDEQTDKSAIFTKVENMLKKSEQLIQKRQHHFSGLPMQRKIDDMAKSIQYRDNKNFRVFLSDIENTTEMSIDLKMAEALASK